MDPSQIDFEMSSENKIVSKSKRFPVGQFSQHTFKYYRKKAIIDDAFSAWKINMYCTVRIMLQFC